MEEGLYGEEEQRRDNVFQCEHCLAGLEGRRPIGMAAIRDGMDQNGGGPGRHTKQKPSKVDLVLGAWYRVQMELDEPFWLGRDVNGTTAGEDDWVED